MRPIIGITAPLREGKVILSQDVNDSILDGGGLPFTLPYTANLEVLRELTGRLDGLLLTGGVDVDPSLFGEEPLPGLGEIMPERDELEMRLTQLALAQNLPILAICRGVQLLNVVAGGTLYQDLASQKEQVLQHSQKAPRDYLSHSVEIAAGSKLEQIIGSRRIKVNSFHHQAVKQPAAGFRVSALAGDGVIEAIESERHPYVIGVQWHPENTWRNDEPSQKLFASFIEACKS
ncbi:gamma-glutamyl-gamma-aminobutyrate hydrolase family protein [Brevibacillus fulvus]|uniref:Glutamine amidotransferase n=1 Tax=Brevibacillus fulvus TaxID=1125967 RepID=A0A939BR74_9BACL|nr:gamma-glutamyl-gamma-aminobutyrate hydrolase family protein [Brevibacillus fulvus]MBM7589173.1 putative glutamine amidotransferase [Brevibacillus fulvus]